VVGTRVWWEERTEGGSKIVSGVVIANEDGAVSFRGKKPYDLGSTRFFIGAAWARVSMLRGVVARQEARVETAAADLKKAKHALRDALARHALGARP
jgi:hypothetical protein